jgi:heterotetrameric sarcosine oxidase gamma subunit
MSFQHSDHEPLHGPAPEANQGSSVRLEILSGRSCWGLKSWLPDQARATGVEFAGLTLRSTVGATVAGEPRVLCLAPDEWQVVADTMGAKRALTRAGSLMDAYGVAAVDLSDALSILRIQGRDAREVLAKGCGLDLHPRVFPVCRCARTRFAGLAVALDCVEQERFELYVARSYSAYLHAWLVDAVAEFQD